MPKTRGLGAGKAKKEVPKGAGALSQAVGDLARLQSTEKMHGLTGQNRVYSFISYLPSCLCVGYPH